MRIIKIVLFCILYFQFVVAQTTPEQPVKKPAKIKTHALSKGEDFNTWDIGLNIGMCYPFTDISGSGNFGISVDASKFFTHTFALQTRIMHASLSGTDQNNPDYQFNTTINYDISLNALFQFGNISYLKRKFNIAPYAFIGIGFINYSPEVFTDGGYVSKSGIYSQYSQPLEEMDYDPTTDLLIPFGFGLKYNISKNYSVSAEYSVRYTNSDKLDGFYKLLSSQDNYSFLSAGVTYHFGTKSKSLEWTNPMQSVYDELYDLKDKMKLLTKDTDQDGVPDMYDKEPETTPGTKVFGDGTSVDTDGDGIPDSNDVEPFSERGASVDVFGRTIGKPAPPIIQPDTSGRIMNQNSQTPNNNNLIDVPVLRVDNDNKSNTSNTTTIIDTDKNKGTDSIHSNNQPVSIVPPNNISNTSQSDTSQRKKNIEIPSVYFTSGEYRITAGHFKTLDLIGHIMMDNPNINYNIIGVSDNIGNLQFNITLSKRRAESVKKYLENNYNINPIRLSVSTVGSYEPSKNSSESNRRVDIKER